MPFQLRKYKIKPEIGQDVWRNKFLDYFHNDWLNPTFDALKNLNQSFLFVYP